MEAHSPALPPSQQEGTVAGLLPSPTSLGVHLAAFLTRQLPRRCSRQLHLCRSFLQRSALLLCVTAGRILLQSHSCARLLTAPAAGCILWWVPLCIHPSSPALFPCARSFLCACHIPEKGSLVSVCLSVLPCPVRTRGTGEVWLCIYVSVGSECACLSLLLSGLLHMTKEQACPQREYKNGTGLWWSVLMVPACLGPPQLTTKICKLRSKFSLRHIHRDGDIQQFRIIQNQGIQAYLFS